MTVKVEKIRISGVPPQYDQVKLDELVTAAQHHYRNSPQNCIVVKASIDKEFFQTISDHLKDGFQLSPFPINYAPLNYNMRLVKSPALQEIDLAQLEVDVKAEYVQFLEAEHVRYKDLLLTQLIQGEQLKAAKKAEQAQEKLLAELQAQVAATFTPLQIPE